MAFWRYKFVSTIIIHSSRYQARLSGISLVLYYISFPNDRTRQKLLVYILFAIITFQTVLNIHDMFLVFGQSFGDLEAISHINIGGLSLSVTTGIGNDFLHALSILFSHW
jgi:hypothetical protein